MTRAGALGTLPVDVPFSGIARRILNTEQATVQEYRFEPGASFPLHRHPQEQITLILEGSVALAAGGETQQLGEGSWSVVTGDLPHGITAGAAGARFLAILVPARSPDESPHLISEPEPEELSP